MDQIRYSDVMTVLKKSLKSQKKSYSDLSNMLKIPESTLKKWFTAKDGSWDRINQICIALNVSIVDVLRVLENTRVETIVMPEKTQKFFLENLEIFKIYWYLVYERKNIEEIQQKLSLSLKTLNTAIVKLDRLNLLKVDVTDQLTVPKVVPVRWSSEGPFMKKIFRDWSLSTLADSLENSDADLILQYFQLSTENEQELRRDLLKLEEKFARKTIQDLRQPDLKTKKVRFLCCASEGSFL